MFFPINVDIGSTSRPARPRLLRAPFGDGYSQVAEDGLNHLLYRWSISISRRPADQVRVALEFLEERGGVHPFEFQDPWEPTLDGHTISGLRATFEQVP